MDRKNGKNGFVMIMILAAFVIIAILFMMNMPGSFLPSRGNEKIDMFAEQPWFEEQRLAGDNAFPIKQTGKNGQTVIEKNTTLTGNISRKGENRGRIELTFAPDGRVAGKCSCQYEYTDSSYQVTAEFAGNIDPTKIYANKDGKNKTLLYFITKGKYTQTKTDKATKGSWTTTKNVYVVGWIKPDYSAQGKAFFMTSEGNDNEDHGNAEYDWQTNLNGEIQMKYIVKKTSQSFKPDGNWNKTQFAGIEAVKLNNFMGEKPEHFPQVEAKLIYDDNSIYVIFKVDDNYVKAINTEYDSHVCQDSCVEFFFTPSNDISQGYFNAEMNCCGTLLLHHQKARGIEEITIAPDDAGKIEIFSTFKGKVEPEITKPTQWFIEYKIPYEILKKYAPFTKPAAGAQWRGNFYKCGDETSKPHWLTWNKVELPKPDFHRPEFFGTLEFK